MAPRRSGRERRPTSYEETPDELYSDSGREYEPRRTSRKRRRGQTDPTPTMTRSGRRITRPESWAEESNRETPHSRLRARRSRRKREPIDYVDESDSPRHSPYPEDDEEDEIEGQQSQPLEEHGDDEEHSDPEGILPKRKSARLSQEATEQGGTNEESESIKMKLVLRNQDAHANDAEMPDANANGSGSDEPEETIKRSTRSVSRIPLIEEESLEEGVADDGAKDDEDFKVTESAENEEEDDDAFEEEKLEPEPESDSHSPHEEPHRIQTRSAKRRRPMSSEKGRRPSARNANDTRDDRRNSGRKYPKRSDRRRPKRLSPSNAPEDRRDARSSYRPRRNSMRPRDYYSAEGSSSSSSEDDNVHNAGNAMSPKPANASASDPNIPDYLQNPMALSAELGRSRSSRYARRRSRNVKAGLDPFANEAHGRPGKFSKHPPIEPIKVDLNLKWEDIGGLDHHVRALKEMVFLPLVYPEVFEKFKIEPPKGVLFYGPPGTGKTLCARTLAASCGAAPESEPQRPVVNVQVPEVAQQADACADTAANPGTTDNVANGAAPNAEVQPDGYIVPTDDGQAANGSVVAMEITSNDGTTEAPAPVSKPVADAMQQAPVLERAASIIEAVRESAVKTRGQVPEDPNALKARRPKVAFFMRNGADCLSKWVGEAERQLRMTFEAAKRHQPSIIFFDEIDGLAPVRSSRQDQIHSSIVSTLLGLMDGLDGRGQIVVIGATNRVDAIDPALRRPGRFDRELIFTLPNAKARRRILEIQTKNWKPAPPNDKVLDAIAERTVGYCGADLRSLCTEAALRALRRRYPQIYESSDKLLIDPNSVQVSTRHFLSAMVDIVPASHRSARTHAKPLAKRLHPILKEYFEECTALIRRVFPQGVPPEVSQNSASGRSSVDEMDEVSDDSEDEETELNEVLGNSGREVYGLSKSSMLGRPAFRPSILVCGKPGLGQAQIAPALLHFLEGCPVHAIDFPSLHMNNSARTPEEALVAAVREACRAAPAVLYLPHLHLWWQTAHESLRTTLLIALRDIPSDLPLLTFATAEEDLASLPPELADLFTETMTLEASKTNARVLMFAPLIEQAKTMPKKTTLALKRKRAERRRELPKAPPPPPKPVSKEETIRQTQEHDRYIRTLRMEMRGFVEQLLRDKKYKVFWDPVDPREAEDYYEIIKEPMDISKIAAQVDKGMYPTVLAMVRDFDLMVKNAIQYNPAHTEEGAAILRRAHGLVDLVHAWADNLNPLLVETCNRIVAKRITEAAAKQKKEEAEMAKKAAAEEKGSDKTGSSVMDIDSIAPPQSENLTPQPANGMVETGAEERSLANGIGAAMETETMPAPSEVDVLRMLCGSVTSGLSVEGLERLHARCNLLLYERRRSRDRARVVEVLSELLVESREDPAIVGTLVE